MMAKKTKKRKKARTPVVRLSPAKYIKSKSRGLPVHECYITDGWQEMGIATVVVTRQQPSGNLIVGTYLVDTMCLGVKDTYYQYNATTWEYEELMDKMNVSQTMVPCDYVLAHNVIYGAIAFAEELGFSPHKDFSSVSAYILEEDDDQVEFIDLEFGRDGEPVLFVNWGVNPTRYIKQLDQSVGEGNYQVVYRGEEWDEDEWSDEDEEEDSDLPELDTERPFRPMIERRVQEATAKHLESTNTSGRQLISMEIVYEPMESEYSKHYADDPAFQDSMDEMYELAQDNPDTAILELRQLVKKYPKHPVFQNYLCIALDKAGYQEEAHRVAEQLYKKFPEYLYARISYADRLLDEQKFEEAFRLFDEKYTLNQVYPGRKTFHFTEVLSFNAFLSRYFLMQGNLDRAVIYYQTMYIIAEDHPQTIAIENMIGAELLSETLGEIIGNKPKDKDQ